MFQSSPAPPVSPRPRRMFQSSPAPRGGCNFISSHWCPHHEQFQSSPAPRSGCNFTFLSLDTVIKVSILTRSEERVQHEEDGEIEEAFEVSILTRSEERVQPYKVSPAWQAAD